MYKALIACRTGMGSSMMLKIKVDQVVKENNFPIDVAHDTLDAVPNFGGDLVITMEDIADDIRPTVPYYVVGVKNLMDKEELRTKLQEFLDSKK